MGRQKPIPLAAMYWAPPLAWFIQFCLNYAVSNHACYPGGTALLEALPGWQGTRGILLLINIAALVVTIVSTRAALRAARRAGALAGTTVNDVEEGWPRFVALWSVLQGLLFVGAVLFQTIGVLMVPACGH